MGHVQPVNNTSTKAYRTKGKVHSPVMSYVFACTKLLYLMLITQDECCMLHLLDYFEFLEDTNLCLVKQSSRQAIMLYILEK